MTQCFQNNNIYDRNFKIHVDTIDERNLKILVVVFFL